MVDTPGLHRPRTLLGRAAQRPGARDLAEVDVIGLCVPADEPVGPGDRYIARELAELRRTPKVAIVTKTDRVAKQAVAEQLLRGRRSSGDFGRGRPGLRGRRATRWSCWPTLLVGLLPEGPALYPDGELTDEPEAVMVAELIREAALEGVRDELPHSIAVVVDEMAPREDRPADRPLLDVRALAVRRAGQPEGDRHRHAAVSGCARSAPVARQQIERLLGTPRLPRPARQGRQGLAARPQAAAPAGLLSVVLYASRVRHSLLLSCRDEGL